MALKKEIPQIQLLHPKRPKVPVYEKFNLRMLKNKQCGLGTKVTDNLQIKVVKAIDNGYIIADLTQWLKLSKDDDATDIDIQPGEFYLLSGFKFNNDTIYIDRHTSVGM